MTSVSENSKPICQLMVALEVEKKIWRTILGSETHDYKQVNMR